MDDFPSEAGRGVPMPPARRADDRLADAPLSAFGHEPVSPEITPYAASADVPDLDFPPEEAPGAPGSAPFEEVVASHALVGAPAAAQPAGRRELMMVMLAVLFGGIVTFALLMSSRGRAESAAAASAAPPSARAPRAAAASTNAPRWNTATREWVGNQRRAAAFELAALNKVQAWTHQAHPMLVVRCVARRVETFVYIESAAQLEAQDENHSVRVRFDDEKETNERWADSAEHDALFAPDGAAFARRLVSARTLHFSYTPHNSPRANVEFDVAGLGPLVEGAARSCGLTP